MTTVKFSEVKEGAQFKADCTTFVKEGPRGIVVSSEYDHCEAGERYCFRLSTEVEIEEVTIDELTEALKGLVAIAADSLGVYGYHRNGDLAEWDEFPEVAEAEALLEKFNSQKQ